LEGCKVATESTNGVGWKPVKVGAAGGGSGCARSI